MSKKLIPRDGMTPAWREEFRDVTDAHGVSMCIATDGPPTLRLIQERLSTTGQSFSDEAVTAFWGHCITQWKAANTMLYRILRHNTDHTGVNESNDLEHMERHFKVGDQRNGREYYFWLLSLKVTDNGNDQVLLQQELFKLKLGSNALRDDYSRHLTTVHCCSTYGRK